MEKAGGDNLGLAVLLLAPEKGVPSGPLVNASGLDGNREFAALNAGNRPGQNADGRH